MTDPVPIKTKKTSKKRGVTRESLLDAGLRLFSEKGFDGTSIKDVEAMVGLTPGSGSFYRHFKSKEELMENVVHREIEKVRGWREMRHQAIGSSLGDRRAEMIMNFRLGLMGMDEIRDLINLLGREYGHERFEDLMVQLRQLLVDEGVEFSSEEYAEDMKKGVIRGDDPEALSAILTSAMVGYHLARTFFGTPIGDIDSDRFVENLVDLVVKQ